MQHRLLILLALIVIMALASSALADTTWTRISIRPIAGASIGSIQMGENAGINRVSYWAGAYLKSLTPDVHLYAAYQRAVMDALDVSGGGGKLLLSVTHKDYDDWFLLVGGGWLGNFALEGDGQTRTAAFSLDMGVMYEWLTDQVLIGALGSAVDYGPRFDYSIDLGVAVMF